MYVRDSTTDVIVSHKRNVIFTCNLLRNTRNPTALKKSYKLIDETAFIIQKLTGKSHIGIFLGGEHRYSVANEIRLRMYSETDALKNAGFNQIIFCMGNRLICYALLRRKRFRVFRKQLESMTDHQAVAIIGDLIALLSPKQLLKLAPLIIKIIGGDAKLRPMHVTRLNYITYAMDNPNNREIDIREKLIVCGAPGCNVYQEIDRYVQKPLPKKKKKKKVWKNNRKRKGKPQKNKTGYNPNLFHYQGLVDAKAARNKTFKYRCPGCKMQYYCSRKCYKLDWPRHSKLFPSCRIDLKKLIVGYANKIGEYGGKLDQDIIALISKYRRG